MFKSNVGIFIKGKKYMFSRRKFRRNMKFKISSDWAIASIGIAFVANELEDCSYSAIVVVPGLNRAIMLSREWCIEIK